MKKDYNKSELLEKTMHFVRSIDDLQDSLPLKSNFGLAMRIKYCVDSVPPSINSLYLDNRRIDKIRSWIKANGYLEECKNYLKLIDRLEYNTTFDLQMQVEEICDMLWGGFDTLKFKTD